MVPMVNGFMVKTALIGDGRMINDFRDEFQPKRARSCTYIFLEINPPHVQALFQHIGLKWYYFDRLSTARLFEMVKR